MRQDGVLTLTARGLGYGGHSAVSEEAREAARVLREASGLPRPEGWEAGTIQFHRIVVVGQVVSSRKFSVLLRRATSTSIVL